MAFIYLVVLFPYLVTLHSEESIVSQQFGMFCILNLSGNAGECKSDFPYKFYSINNNRWNWSNGRQQFLLMGKTIQVRVHPSLIDIFGNIGKAFADKIKKEYKGYFAICEWRW